MTSVPPVPTRARNAHHAEHSPSQVVLWWRHVRYVWRERRNHH